MLLYKKMNYICANYQMGRKDGHKTGLSIQFEFNLALVPCLLAHMHLG